MLLLGEDLSQDPYLNASPVIYWKDNLAWTHGKHATKMGFIPGYNANFLIPASAYDDFDTTEVLELSEP